MGIGAASVMMMSIPTLIPPPSSWEVRIPRCAGELPWPRMSKPPGAGVQRSRAAPLAGVTGPGGPVKSRTRSVESTAQRNKPNRQVY